MNIILQNVSLVSNAEVMRYDINVADSVQYKKFIFKSAFVPSNIKFLNSK